MVEVDTDVPLWQSTQAPILSMWNSYESQHICNEKFLWFLLPVDRDTTIPPKRLTMGLNVPVYTHMGRSWEITKTQWIFVVCFVVVFLNVIELSLHGPLRLLCLLIALPTYLSLLLQPGSSFTLPCLPWGDLKFASTTFYFKLTPAFMLLTPSLGFHLEIICQTGNSGKLRAHGMGQSIMLWYLFINRPGIALVSRMQHLI